ncbi:MAG: hypothetical protein R3Y29_03010 [bacterium]
MFEAKKTEFVNKTFRLEKPLVDKLSKYASETNISLNSLVSQCCEYALSNINTGDKDLKK